MGRSWVIFRNVLNSRSVGELPRIPSIQTRNLAFRLQQKKSLCSSSQPSSSNLPTSDGIFCMEFERGLPQLTLPLPSRQEKCRFSLRPLTDTVGSLCDSVQLEDKGLDFVAVYTFDSARIALSTSVEHLIQMGSFRLRLNDKYYDIIVPSSSSDLESSSERLRELDDIRATVASLHAALCVDDYKLGRERKILVQLERAETDLRPLQEHKLQIERECEGHAERVMWAGFAAMGIQTGLFARLTWWEYSWDIMEPVTYFATYASVVATFGYYLYARQPFEYPLVRERTFTKAFYKRARKQNFDIEKYNTLVTEVEELRGQLNRIRDPLFQHLPVSHLSRLDDDSTAEKRNK